MLEIEIQGLREDIRALTAALKGAFFHAPTYKEEPVVQVEPAPVAEPEHTPVAEPEPAPVTVEPVDVEAVKDRIRKLVIDVSTKHGSESFMAVLGRYGVKTLKEVNQDSYSELIAHLGRVLEQGPAAV